MTAFLVVVILAGGGALGVRRVLGYEEVKRQLDRLAPDGGLESFTPELFERLVAITQGCGLLAIASGLGMLSRRRRLEAYGSRLEGALREAWEPHRWPATRSRVSRRLNELRRQVKASRAMLTGGLALGASFGCFYYYGGWALSATGLFDHFDGLFQSDPPRVIRDMTLSEVHGGRSQVHPLFILLVNPAGSRVAGMLGSPTESAVVLAALAGSLSVFLGAVFFHRIGMRTRDALLWSAVYGAAASQVMFSMVPETFVFGGLTSVICCLAVTGRVTLAKAFPAALAAFGITSTNLGPAAILYFTGLRSKLTARLVRTAVLVLFVLAMGVALAGEQKRRFPQAKYFFDPSTYEAGVTQYFFDWGGAGSAMARLESLAGHIFVYGLIAPVPYLTQLERPFHPSLLPIGGFECHGGCARSTLAEPKQRAARSHPIEITFPSPTAFTVSAPGAGALVVWLGLIAGAVHSLVRNPGVRIPLLAGLAAAVLFHLGLHMMYGDNFFLYSPHWTFMTLAVVALSLRPHWAKRWLAAIVACLLAPMAWNNLLFLDSLLRANGSSLLGG